MGRKGRKNKASIPILATAKPAPSAGFNRFKRIKEVRPRSRPDTNPLKQTFYQEMKGAKPKYKLLKLYNAGGDLAKEWYVQYWFLDPATGKYERFKITFDINRIHDLADRMLFGNRAVEFMKRQLDNGYDPFQELSLLHQPESPANLAGPQPVPAPIPVAVVEPVRPLPSPHIGNLIVIQQIVDKLSRGATKDAKDTYRTMMNRWTNYATEKGLDKLPVQEITTKHVKAFLEYLQHEKKNARKTINATKSHLGQFWDELRDDQLVANNPFREVRGISKRAARRMANKPLDKYKPPTTEELERIIKYLNDNGMRGYLRFLSMIYYAWVRPEEITQLRINNVDMKNATITFTSDLTKNEKPATIQIVPPLLKILKELKVEEQPKHFFLFSKDYLPGSSQLNAKYHCSNYWRRHVKNKIENGTDINPYSFKHKGNIDYVMNNKGDKYDARWHQKQNRHSSLAQTEQYMRDLGVYFVDTEQLTFNGFM